MTLNRSKKIPVRCAETALERAALRWINRKADGYADGWKGAYADLCRGGCSSGIVSELIYNVDCERFARRHLVDILAIMEDVADNTGEAPTPNRRDGMTFDATWLAWYGFEHAAGNVAERMEQAEDMDSDPSDPAEPE
jgi:hypothetical protein